MVMGRRVPQIVSAQIGPLESPSMRSARQSLSLPGEVKVTWFSLSTTNPSTLDIPVLHRTGGHLQGTPTNKMGRGPGPTENVWKLEDPLEKQLLFLTDQEKHIQDEFEDMIAQWHARTLRTRDFIAIAQAADVVEEERVEALQHVQAKHEKLKAELGKWWDDNEEWHIVELSKLADEMQECSDHLAVLIDLIDEDIAWYRNQKWQPAGGQATPTAS